MRQSFISILAVVFTFFGISAANAASFSFKAAPELGAKAMIYEGDCVNSSIPVSKPAPFDFDVNLTFKSQGSPDYCKFDPRFDPYATTIVIAKDFSDKKSAMAIIVMEYDSVQKLYGMNGYHVNQVGNTFTLVKDNS